MTDDNEYVFSKQLRDALKPIGHMSVGDALKSPDFFEILMDYAGMDRKSKNDLWDKVGRPDLQREEER